MDKRKGHKMAAGLCLLAALSLASGCGSKAEQETTAASALAEETMTAAETAETETETEAETAETYPGTLSAAEGEEQAYFGVMYASVLDLWQDGEGVNIYSLQDSNDPENIWTVSGLDIALHHHASGPALQRILYQRIHIPALIHRYLITDIEPVYLFPVEQYTVLSYRKSGIGPLHLIYCINRHIG